MNSSKKIYPSKKEKTKFVKPNIIRGASNNDIIEVNLALNANPMSIVWQNAFGNTAIHASAFRGNFNMVAHLIAQPHADLWIKNGEGLDPLDIALNIGHHKMIALLFKVRAEQLDLFKPEDEVQTQTSKIIPFKPAHD